LTKVIWGTILGLLLKFINDNQQKGNHIMQQQQSLDRHQILALVDKKAIVQIEAHQTMDGESIDVNFKDLPNFDDNSNQIKPTTVQVTARIECIDLADKEIWLTAYYHFNKQRWDGETDLSNFDWTPDFYMIEEI